MEDVLAMALPEVHVVCGNRATATQLGPVVHAMRLAGLLAPVLIVAGTDPAAVTAAFAEANLLTDVALPAGPVAGLIARFDRMWANRTPSAILVAGGDPAGLSAALAGGWRGVPVAHLDAGARTEEVAADTESDARLITQLAAVHLVTRPVDAMNLLDEGVPAGDVLITGDDTLAPRRAAQAVAAAAGLAQRPAPMPVTVPPATVRFGG